jgi:thioredoxin reductase (NADPH)
MPPPTGTLIVGAGPIGLELGAALKLANSDFLHIDAAQVGHTISWWAPGTRFFSSPERLALAGIPLVSTDQGKPTREEYLAYLRLVVQHFGLTVRTFERVESIQAHGDGFRVIARSTLDLDGAPVEYSARHVVLAIGDMHRPRLLNIPGEDLAHVHHYFGDPHEYFRRRVLIIGGRNSAVEAAIRLHRIGAEVTVSYRGDRFDPQRIKYWLLPEIEWLIGKGKIGWRPRTIPVQITPRAVQLRSVDGAEGAGDEVIDAEAVLAMTGYVQDPSLFVRCGIELVGEARAPRHNPATMETNIPNLFVAGTASAGTQSRFRAFIETSHEHVDRIMRRITGKPAPFSTQRSPVVENSLES